MSLIKYALVGLSLLASLQGFAGQQFPVSPDPNLTPGSLCDYANQLRYPEKIKYCERDVEPDLKREIIQDYNRKLGYNIQPKQRQQFKIDHYIPLCMGGSNHKDNLWPQHETIYKHTDLLEAKACEKMSQGKLTQRRALDYIRAAKADYRKAHQILAEIERL